ncbi:MAG: SDR family NAD(P)-dependent oxidoreductase, partial [Halobacteriota archaeon]
TNIYQATTIANLAPEQRAAYEQQMTAPKKMDASKAARTILGGVSRNQAIIAFPANVRLAWRLYRLSPHLMDRLLLYPTRNFRKYRLNP